MRKQFILGIPLVLALSLSLTMSFPLITFQPTCNEPRDLNSISSYTESDAIVIDSPDDFVTYGFAGDGNESTPYLIEGLEIATGNSTDAIHIDINEDIYYTITGCNLSSANGAAINLLGGIPTIEDSLVHSSEDGILISTNHTQIISCNISECNIGITVIGSHVLLQQNTLTNCSAITLWMPDGLADIIIVGNTFNAYVAYSTITGDDIQGLTMTDNIVHGMNALVVLSGINITMVSNYFHAHSYQPASIISIRFTRYINDGWSENVHVANCELISESTTGHGLHFGAVRNVTVTDSLFLMQKPGYYVSFSNCTDFLLKDSEIGLSLRTENPSPTTYGTGVAVAYTSYDGMVTNCTLRALQRAVTIDGNDTYVTNCTITQNDVGVTLEGNMNHVYYNNISKCEVAAKDNGLENVWDNSVSLGNWWDTGIVDGTRPIDGTAGNLDRYPISTAVDTTTTSSASTTTSDTSTATGSTTGNDIQVDLGLFIGIGLVGGIIAIGVAVCILRKRA